MTSPRAPDAGGSFDDLPDQSLLTVLAVPLNLIKESPPRRQVPSHRRQPLVKHRNSAGPHDVMATVRVGIASAAVVFAVAAGALATIAWLGP